MYGAYGLAHRLYSKVAGGILDLEVIHIFEMPVTDGPLPIASRYRVVPPGDRASNEADLDAVGALERLPNYPAETVTVIALCEDGGPCGRLLAHPEQDSQGETDSIAWWVMAVDVEEAHRGQRHYAGMLEALMAHLHLAQPEVSVVRLFTHSYTRAALRSVERFGFTYRYTRVRAHYPRGASPWARWPWPVER